jgi:transposase InsO family protein
VQRPRKGIPDKHPDGHKIYPYLLEGVEVPPINQVWSTDITYIPMAEGFVYLVPGLVQPVLLSWAQSPTMELGLSVEALKRAFGWGRPEILNGDQGSQFTSEKFAGELESRGVAVSMDGRGRYLASIFIERLWRSLKREEKYLRDYGLVPEARTGIRVRVAVGISVARYPPHRSPRAALPHEALILDEWRQSELGGKDVGRAELGSIAPPVGAFAPNSGSPSGHDGSEPAAIAGSPESGIRGGDRCCPVPRDS